MELWIVVAIAGWCALLIVGFAVRVLLTAWRETRDTDALDDYNQHGITPPLTEHEHEKHNRRSIFQ